MSIRETLMRAFSSRLLENPAKHKTYDQLIDELEIGMEHVLARAAGKLDSPANRDVFGYIIGTERWSQRRLRTLQGEPVVEDEVDHYRPRPAMSLNALRREFVDARSQSISLARALQAAGVPLTATARHNDAGDMSVGAWLAYINTQADRESRRLK